MVDLSSVLVIICLQRLEAQMIATKPFISQTTSNDTHYTCTAFDYIKSRCFHQYCPSINTAIPAEFCNVR